MLNLKKIVDEYSGNFDSLINELQTIFKHNFIMYFKVNSLSGFEFPYINNYLATNEIPKNFDFFFSNHNSSIIFKFFCDLESIYQDLDEKKFFDFLKKSTLNNIFYLTPFSNFSEEKYLIIKYKIEITVTLDTDKVSFNIQNFDNENINLNNLEKNISAIFEAPFIRKNFYQKGNENISSLEKEENQIKKAIDLAKMQMNKGECYLANIAYTKRLENSIFPTPTEFFASWSQVLSRFAIYFNSNKIGIASFSPERFLQKIGNYLLTEPIKGTLKSEKKFPCQNDAKTLWDNKKEIYEHTMIVDLLRNDLYFVSKSDSVQVFKPFYARIAGSLLQMQSFIISELKENMSLGDCLEKMLPAGSISGTPKRRVCQLIHQLEENPRGYYTGICGFLQANGDFDSIILIRSLFKGELGIYVGVGAGITTLSNTDDEFNELNIKMNSFASFISGTLV